MTETKTVYRFSYQLDGDETIRFMYKAWRLPVRAAYSLAWRMLNRKYPNVLWMEC